MEALMDAAAAAGGIPSITLTAVVVLFVRVRSVEKILTNGLMSEVKKLSENMAGLKATIEAIKDDD